MRLGSLSLHRLSVPLNTPYRLAITELTHFDTLIVEAADTDDRRGLGEATILTGYTDETIEASWAMACRLAQKVVHESLEDAKTIVGKRFAETPFVVSALTSAFEMLQGSPHLGGDSGEAVPLVALVQSGDARGLATEVESLLERGYATFKVKVGFDVADDLARVGRLQDLVAGRARLRLDANQGYCVEDARRFATALSPEGIELLEQPCAADDWNAAHLVARASAVPIMLDESIYDLADVERAAGSGAEFVKFKLMKAGGLDRLSESIARANALGLKTVLGNGVACDVGCWMEACVARGRIETAGEMNGFLKTPRPLLRTPLEVVSGAIQLRPGFEPALDPEAIARFSVAREHFCS